jgi:polyhydroxyalkanoate synthase
VSAAEFVAGIRRELEHSATRTRNGLEYLSGASRPRIAPTPRDLVWQRGKAQLWRYRSPNVRRHPPLLLFMGLVSRPYVFDLLPENSFVARLGASGFDVFLLDWGIPDAIEAENTFETYVNDYLPRAIRVLAPESRSNQVTLIAYCMGAIFALLLAATRHDVPIRGMVTLAAPVDFAKQGAMVRPLRDGSVLVDVLIDDDGLVPAEVLRGFQHIRKPTGDALHYAGIWEKLSSDEALEGHLAMAQWIRDHVPMPGAAFRQMADMFILGNSFVEGAPSIGGRVASLADVRVPILSVVAERDDVVPSAASRDLPALVGRDLVSESLIPAGHAGLVVGRAAAQHTLPRIIEWLRQHSDELEART